MEKEYSMNRVCLKYKGYIIEITQHKRDDCIYEEKISILGTRQHSVIGDDLCHIVAYPRTQYPDDYIEGINRAKADIDHHIANKVKRWKERNWTL